MNFREWEKSQKGKSWSQDPQILSIHNANSCLNYAWKEQNHSTSNKEKESNSD